MGGTVGRTNKRTNEGTDRRITIFPPNFVCGGNNKRTINARQLTSALDLLLWKIGGHADLSDPPLGSPNPIDNPIASPIASRTAIPGMVTAIFFLFESVCQYATKEQKQDAQG